MAGGGTREELQLDNAVVPIGKPIDANKYATKKTIAQGMLDIALLTANASQLKYVLQLGKKHEFYTVMLTLISSSIVLQVIVGILFIAIGAMNINQQQQQRTADILNDVVVLVIFVISAINIIISSFGIQHTDNVTWNSSINSTSLSKNQL